ncbi:MAG: YcaQ family DNA glycosylase [Acidobacteria bacterium]|nr:YcaQ family DNA glycosylase [Acidobacteriota bacterium]MBV9478096.1 YcaQ family DNA glycosylase [Acidobacteriota bacterium]
METLSRADARRLLVAHLGLARSLGRGRAGTRKVLDRLRCIQLDPLDPIGTNADLVVMARTEGVARGDVWRHLFPREAFEHFAKERCILPASAFPWYRVQGHAAQTPWWRHGEREQRLAPRLIAAVLEEVRARGPLTARDLTDHGEVEPIDWAGWRGTAKATSMALEVLWTRCDVVVAGRTSSGAKLYDVPERALGRDVATEKPRGDFARWALRERAHAAGLLTRASGAMWSMLSNVRTSGVVDAMLADGELVEVAIEDSARRYLAVPSFLTTPRPRYDDRVRILGPLDPLLWDRDLVRHVFAFEYVWEVYKPAAQRRWGWYVCPLLHHDRFLGRLDARIDGKRLVVSKLWLEDAATVSGDDRSARASGDDRSAIVAALERHAELCGAEGVKMPRRW